MINIYLTQTKFYIVNKQKFEILKTHFFNSNEQIQKKDIIDTIYFNNPKIENIIKHIINLIKTEYSSINTYIIFDDYWYRILTPRFIQFRMNKLILKYDNIKNKHDFFENVNQNKIYCYAQEKLRLEEINWYKLKQKNKELAWSKTNIYLKTNDNVTFYNYYEEISKLFKVPKQNILYENNIIKKEEITTEILIYNIDNLCNNFYINDETYFNKYIWTVKTIKPYKLQIIQKNKKQTNIYSYK